MGRKNKRYSKKLKEQIYDILTSMLHAGEGTSKKKAILDGTDKEKIFSYSTYDTYSQHCKCFASYIMDKHPECMTLKAAKKYVNEWLQSRVEYIKPDGTHLSAWTIQTEAKALGKLYGIRPDDPDYFKAPKRKRQEIKRSRQDVKTDRHFSVTNNDEFIKFFRGVGCRRAIAKRLKGSNYFTREAMCKEIKCMENVSYLSEAEHKKLRAMKEAVEMFPDQEHFIYHHLDKGGRDRVAPIIGKNKNQIIERMISVGADEKVWKHVPKNADIHGYRGEYASEMYKIYARPIEQIPYDKINRGTGKKYQSGVYVCRKDESGKRLDKEAMLKVSKALGHNRLEVVANNYLRGL